MTEDAGVTSSTPIAPYRIAARPETLTWVVTVAMLSVGTVMLEAGASLLLQVATGLAWLLPVVLIGALLASILGRGNWTDRTLRWIHGHPVRAVLLASAAGTVTPVCGLGVLPLIAALLRRGVPIAPVMAFWISSPIMGPGMVVVTIAILGPQFALAKALAAFGVGLFAGAVTAALPRFAGNSTELMRTTYLEAMTCSAAQSLWRETLTNVRLAMRWLALALTLEVFVQSLLPPNWVESIFGGHSAWAVPIAAVIGAPLYLDGFAALPLVRSLLDKGMGFGAALALLISGAAVSLYAAVAVAAIVRASVFVLYLGLAVTGACGAGFVALWVVG